jgi:hypothetical protein
VLQDPFGEAERDKDVRRLFQGEVEERGRDCAALSGRDLSWRSAVCLCGARRCVGCVRRTAREPRPAYIGGDGVKLCRDRTVDPGLQGRWQCADPA